MRILKGFGGLLVAVAILVLGLHGIANAATVDPPSLDFGYVALYNTYTQTISVTLDTGDYLYSEGGNFSLDFVPGSTTCDGANFTGTCVFSMSFIPRTLGLQAGTLNFTECPVGEAGGANCVPISINVSGTGFSEASVNPLNWDFGDVVLNTTATQNLIVTTDTSYSVGDVITSGNGAFGIDFGNCLNAGGTCDMSVTFKPTTLGPQTGSLTILECQTGRNCLPLPVINLSGNGVSPLGITTTSLPNGLVGTPYSATLASSGGVGSIHWSVSSGSLPPGLALDPSTGTITGTPTSPGTSAFAVTATDSGTPTPQTATASFTIAVAAPADLALNVSGPAKPVQAGKPVTLTLTVQNLGPASSQAVVATDALPSASQFVSGSVSQGSCSTPPAGSTGTVTCSLGTLANGATAHITLTIQPVIKKGTISDTATVSASTPDPMSANNSATVTVQIK